VYVSAASIWKIAIKARLGKIEGDAQAFAAAIEATGFEELTVTPLPMPQRLPDTRCITRIPLIACCSPRRSVSRCGS